ncbi:MAG: helix-turn-helix transcriptional regulator, partial [Flavobacteriaceae bacterium]|nr:helix-turn-helix transcriptional regulator [Flavobacteriaceae bacterium]
ARNSAFDSMKDADAMKTLREKYVPNFQWGSATYIYAGLIGFFIVALFFIQKRTDKIAISLLSIFIFIHSFFIIHVGLHWMNYGYYFPHTYAMSTVFSFLYGPLIYFYFKRIKTGYNFRWKDTLHLLPTLALFIYFAPIYILSESEKLDIMLGVGIYEDRPYGLEIAFVKMILLIIYTYFTVRIFKKHRNTTEAPEYKNVQNWQRNIVVFQVVFTIVYSLYWLTLVFYYFNEFFFHTQLIILSGFVLYVAYMAYINPKTLMGYQLEASFSKYKNSGLTDSYSVELKKEILKLLENDKIYRENDLSLTILAERVGTNRHGASQVINEHFGLNYFELINQYRINEAIEIFKADVHREQSIIDVAYTVGFNNKVTFNKAFKKIMECTPTQFLKTLNTPV